MRPAVRRQSIALIAAPLIVWALAACAQAAPTPTLTPVPSLTPSPDIQAAVEQTLTALAPTGTPEPVTPTATPAPTETIEVITLAPLAGEHIPPPLDITLPEDWRVGYDVLVLNDMGALRGVPLAIYRGPVAGGTGTIVLLWGFPNLANPFPGPGTPAGPDLWADGVRLLRLAVLEQDCNIGTDRQRSYRVGTLSAMGAQFSAVECPELPNTRGWFAGLQESGLNFVFYAYAEGDAVVDPLRVEQFNAAAEQMQAVLDTVRFRVPEATPEATAAP